jgi:amino acid permease
MSATAFQAVSETKADRRVFHPRLAGLVPSNWPTPMERPGAIRLSLNRRLESLSPFWTAFSLTLTETAGAGILALPIALAGVGPLPGLLILLVLGAINVLTIAGMAEAVVRNGAIRDGNAFMGRLVSDYLGRTGSLILSVGLAANCLLFQWAYYVGFSTTLADATRVPAPLWVTLLFLVGLYFISREKLNATTAVALGVGALNLGLILILSLLALAHFKPANLLYANVPSFGGHGFDTSTLRLVFGVVAAAYFGHLSVGNCAREVLARDPGGRSLIWGAVAAQIVVMALYGLWTLAVNTAIDPDALTAISGTALAPMADEIGPVVHVLGSVFVVLAMGIGSIHNALGLFNLVRERLPTRSHGPTLGRRACFTLSAAPVVLVFLLVQWMLLTERGSFAEPLSFLGVIVMSLLGGIFPMLLLMASRHKGTFAPGISFRALGNRAVTLGIAALYLTGLFLHGLIIWQDPLQRAAALSVSVMTLGGTIMLARRGLFAPTDRRAIDIDAGSDQGANCLMTRAASEAST